MLKYVFHSEGERAARRISWYMLWLISHFHRKRRSQLGMISQREKGVAKWDCYGIMGELSFWCQRAIWSLQNTSRYKFVCLLSLSPSSFSPPPTSCLLSLSGPHVPRMTLNAASASQVLWLQACTATRGFTACLGGTLGLHMCVGRSSPTEPYRQSTSILLCTTEKSLGIKH